MIFTAPAAAILASALFGGANAHIYMQEPKPYNFDKVSTTPLGSANGLPFPCQGPIDSTTPPTAAQAGGAIKVKFGGSATHGGGTCQFSVTYENPPPADPSKWKVIQTVVGGCPTTFEGNIPGAGTENGRPAGAQCAEGETGPCLSSFNVPISKDIKNGKATFAWTWFNKVGNREMYMNCAPVEITGGKDDDSGMADLPSMFMANVDSKPCTTLEQVLDLKKVGGNVVVLQDAKEESLGTCPVPNGPLPEGGVGGGNGNADTSNPIPDESAPPAAAPPAAAPPANPGNQLAETPAPAPAAPATPSQPETPVVAPSQPAAPAPPTGDGVPCPAGTADGAIFCISTTQWATCNWGTGVPMAVAGGLQCVGNNPNTPIPARKRHVHRHLRPHARSFL